MRTIFCCLFYLLFFFLSATATEQDYYFKQISLQEGLTQSSVKCMYRDHKGLIWIGTRNGLNCYDGYELKQYYTQSGDEHSLPDNQIIFITEDSLDNLWISTNTGLVRYNRNNDNFERIYYNNRPLAMKSFVLLPQGVLFGAHQQLFLFNYQNQKLDSLPLRHLSRLSSPFTRMLAWDSTTLLLGTRMDGLWKYHRNNGYMEKATFYPENTVMALCKDSLGQLWIAPYAKGIYCFSPEGKEIYHFTMANSALNHNTVLDLTEKDQKIWIATDGGGINILEPARQHFSHIMHQAENPASIPVNTITCLYNDKQNILWVGTFRGGLLRIKETFIHTYQDVPLGNPWGLSEKTILCLYEDQNQQLWVGTDGGGINCYDLRKKNFQHFPATYQTKIASIAPWSEQELLLSLFGKGLYIFHKKTGELQPFIIINSQVNAAITSSGITINLQKNGDKIFLYGDKIYVYNCHKKTFSPIVSDLSPILQSSLKIIASNDSLTWTFRSSSVFETHHATNQLRLLYTLPDKEEILAASRDPYGHFWLGTASGLYCYTPASQTTQHISSQLFQAVTSLLADTEGRLWIGARNMLFCYLIRENKFITFGESDGVLPNEFLAKPTLLSASGNIFLGGTNGLVHIGQQIPLHETSSPMIELADILIDGNPIKRELLTPACEITIPWNHSSIRIKTMTNEKEFFREKRYRYQISPLNDKYVETFDRTFSLGTLPTGRYTVYVQCDTRTGDWTSPVSLLTVTVTPPWWKSWWFLLICLLVLTGIVFLSFILYVQKKENRYKWQMKEHEQKIYEQKVQFLINISHELRTPLTLIYAPLKRILDRLKNQPVLEQELTGIFKQARQMKNIINMVLDVRKIELGKDHLQAVPTDINQWVKQIGDDFKNEFASKNIQLIYQLDPSLPVIPFDPGKCEIILSNLLMNALKFSNPDSTVTLSTTFQASFIRISVCDEGIGLQHSDPDQLFTRFYQGKHDRNGSGIGLSYAKALVELHKGAIGAYNNTTKGATFWFELPLQNQLLPETDKLPISSPEITSCSITDTSNFSTQPYTVLIVEDEPNLRLFIKESLKEHFKRIYTAENGKEALQIIQDKYPDLVVSDVMMPFMNGYELCKNIKENLEISHIPVILLTARTDSESTAIGYKTGADIYIAKPFEVDFLYTVIKNQLRNREIIREKYRKEKLLLSPEKITFSNADEQFLKKLNEIVETEISNPNLNVVLITDRMAMSRSSLYAKMKALTGIGVNDYITGCRLRKAAFLLETTNLNITEITENTGFTNTQYFSTLFRQQEGISPSAYRKQKQEKNNETTQ